jgi:predicted SAM-dependent methyltransferase
VSADHERQRGHAGPALRILNLGCGTKTHPACINIDQSPYLVLKTTPVVRRIVPLLLRGERRQRYLSLPDSIIVHDLRRGIPEIDQGADVVYHSHILEHIDRVDAPVFLREVHRVLKPGGIHRIVVPDLEMLCREYLTSLDAPAEEHEARIAAIIEQMVRRDPAALTARHWAWRRIERVILGDARKRGETHQWMYDKNNLRGLLASAGFTDIKVVSYRTSDIPGWNNIGLDLDENGKQYKPDSLYMEARKVV